MKTNKGFELSREPKGSMNIFKTKSGHFSIELDGYLLHSKYHPVKEAKKTAEKNYKKNHLHILFGLGLGYVANELLSSMQQDDALFIVEPSIEVFETAKRHGFLEKLLDDNRVHICVGDSIENLNKVLITWIRRFPNRIVFICLQNYDKLYPDVLKELGNEVKKATKHTLIDINTMHFFALKWQKNFVFNLYTSLIKAKAFKEMVGKFSCPVIITSGGPSLIKQLDLLMKVKDKCIVLCVGSTIGSLIKFNIKPHAVVTVDGGEPNYNHFKDINIDDVLLIYELMVYYKIPAVHCGRQAVFNFYKQREAVIKKLQKREIGTAFTGISVANTALSIAVQLTSGPICIIGQDLAYTDNLSHADGNKGLRKIETDDVKGSKRYTTAKGYYGDEVLTDYVFLGMKNNFEEIVSYYKNADRERLIVNATEGGIYIDGMDYMPFKEFINKYCIHDCTDEIQKLFCKSDFKPDIDNFYKNIKKQKQNIKKVIEMCEDAQKKLEKIKSDTDIPNSVLNSLEKIDKKLIKFLKDDFMKDILEPVIFRVYNCYLEKESETPSERVQRILKKSKALYSEIKDAAEATKGFVEELISEIEKDFEKNK